MTVFGWIVISILVLMIVYLIYNLISEFMLNYKLNRFKDSVHELSIKSSQTVLLKKAYQILLLSLFAFTLGISGVFSHNIILGNQKILTQAHQVGSKEKLLSLIDQYSNDYFDYVAEDDMEMMPSEDQNDSWSRDFIDTNTQVEGVSEADIIKTDGNYIFYAARYYQKINVVFIDENYEVDVLESIDLGNVYADNLYLTDDYVIVIGYTYQESPFKYDQEEIFVDWYYQEPTGTVVVIDRDSYEIVYQVETDTFFFDHRMIDHQLYLVSTKYLYTNEDELRPKFIETSINQDTISFVDYDDIYYYEDALSNTMTVITSIDLDELSYDTQAFLGYVNHIYVNENHMFTAYNYYDYEQGDTNSNTYSKIVKFSIDDVNNKMIYQGSQTIKGHILSNYWMDEYDGYLRVVTTTFWPSQNRLYVLEEDAEEDVLNIVSVIDEGLGLENESVKSVRFNQTLAQVVTFEQTDPLYTIDLSDPYDPIINENPIKEEGYSTYIHVWNEDYYLIGFGFDATSTGMITGLKLSAYDTRLDEPIDTYSFASNEEEGFTYSFSEAIYNPKALMVDAHRGVIGFPMSMYTYNEFESNYESSYVLFFIDFTNDQVISDPIFISQDEKSYDVQIDRAIFIEHIIDNVVTDRYIYTFSYEQIIVYHIESNTILEKVQLNEPINAYFD